MLYVWPYFVFFSWPLVLLHVVDIVLPTRLIPSSLQYGLSCKRRLPAIVTFLITIPLMLAAVHFNTIIHPFTLADNRHYVFYVFRILLRYHWAVKYLAAPVYFVCAWCVFAAFGFSAIASQPHLVEPPNNTVTPRDGQRQSAVEETKPKEEKRKANNKNRKASKQTAATPLKQQVITAEITEQIQTHISRRQEQWEAQQVHVSIVLVWLLSTTLSLITAPLVEPRYFIIPWVMWRLHIPNFPAPSKYRRRQRDELDILKAKFFTDLPQILETLWFLVINVVTGYMFLYKGFEWPQEPGKIQRFMW
jgi:alpha-1,2-glucosyltransferase